MTYCEDNVNRCSICLEIQLLLQTFNKNASISVSQNSFYCEVARSPKLSLNVFNPTIHMSRSYYRALLLLHTLPHFQKGKLRESILLCIRFIRGLTIKNSENMITDFPWHVTAKHIRKARRSCMMNSVNQISSYWLVVY